MLIKYSGKYVKIYFNMKITYLFCLYGDCNANWSIFRVIYGIAPYNFGVWHI